MTGKLVKFFAGLAHVIGGVIVLVIIVSLLILLAIS
jgi:hypothetical protein